MIAPLAKFIDWSSIQVVTLWCRDDGRNEELWQAWGRPDLWRLPHGHVSWMAMPGLTGRVLRWLAPRLDAPAGEKRGFRQD
jgi:hypothetical protein